VLSGGIMPLPQFPAVFLGLWEVVIQPGEEFNVPSNLDQGSAFVLSGTVTVERAGHDVIVDDGPFEVSLSASQMNLLNSGSGPVVALIVAATDRGAVPPDDQAPSYRFKMLGNVTVTEPPMPWVQFVAVEFDSDPGTATAPTTSLFPGWTYVEEGRLQHIVSNSVMPAPAAPEFVSESPIGSGSARFVSQDSLSQFVNESSDDARTWTVNILFEPQPGAGGCAGRCRG
jgi:hypothetical protein